MRELIGGSGTDYVAFAITGLVVLVLSLIYVWWIERSSRKLSCPGLKSKDKNFGNLGELTKDGGLHQFLVDNHNNLGPIFSFFWGKDLAVSIASPSLFKDVVTLFDRSLEMFEVFRPMLGQHSLQLMNSPVGVQHRKIHDRHYGFSAIQDYFKLFSEIGKELVTKWNSTKCDEHIPLSQHMLVIAVKSIVKTSFDVEYFKSNKEILSLQEAYCLCWDDMEERINGDLPEPDSERQKTFDRNMTFLREKVRDIINHRRASKERTNNLLDVLLEEEELYPSDDHLIDMVVTYLVGGSHTTGYLLTWAIYFICLHPEVEQKMHEEIVEVLGNDELTLEHCKQLKYMEKVINETLRCSTLATFATRCSAYDIIVGGHIIPKNTPIILALGAVLQDCTIWPEPQKFDPERFNPEQVGLRDTYAFQPFGFAGKRKCPGYRFAFYEAYAYLTAMIRNFKVKLVDGKKISYRYGLLTKFTEEVWITVEQRCSAK